MFKRREFRTTTSAFVWALPTMVVFALLFSACDGGGDGGDATATSDAASATASATGTQVVTDGGEEGLVAQEGDTVALHYRGTLDDGTEFDSSAGRDPLSFEVGAGAVISGFDEAVKGMAVGETKTFRLEPDEAYGQPREDYVVTVEAANAPDGLSVGDQVSLGNAPAVVVAIADNGDVTVDANHPLAGKALTFEIEVVDIQRS
jgi:FKBP-type peptidyl-prolyl cis-trans isomerase 2